MTRTEKIRKLCTAIKDWRGLYHPQTGKYFRAPQAAAVERVKSWLEKLGRDVDADVARIEAFEFSDQMTEYLKELEEAKPSTHSPVCK